MELNIIQEDRLHILWETELNSVCHSSDPSSFSKKDISKMLNVGSENNEIYKIERVINVLNSNGFGQKSCFPVDIVGLATNDSRRLEISFHDPRPTAVFSGIVSSNYGRSVKRILSKGQYLFFPGWLEWSVSPEIIQRHPDLALHVDLIKYL